MSDPSNSQQPSSTPTEPADSPRIPSPGPGFISTSNSRFLDDPKCPQRKLEDWSFGLPHRADPIVSPTLRQQVDQDPPFCRLPIEDIDSYPRDTDTVNPALLQDDHRTGAKTTSNSSIPEAGGYEPYSHIPDYAPAIQPSSSTRKRRWQIDDDDDYEPADNDSFSRNYPPAPSTSRKKPKITRSSQAPTISRRDKPRRRKRSRTYEPQVPSSSRQIPQEVDEGRDGIILRRPRILDQLGYLPLPGQRRDDAALVLPETTVRRTAPSSRSMMSGDDAGSSVEAFEANVGDQLINSTILRTEDLPGRRESGNELDFFFQDAAESSSPPKLEEQESENEVTLVEPPPSSRKKSKARERERNPSSSSWPVPVPVESLGGRRAAQQARTRITEQFGQAGDVESFIGGAGASSDKKRKRTEDEDEYDPSDQESTTRQKGRKVPRRQTSEQRLIGTISRSTKRRREDTPKSESTKQQPKRCKTVAPPSPEDEVDELEPESEHEESGSTPAGQGKRCTVGSCLRVFTRASDRLRHERTVHGNGPRYLCHQCNHDFSRSDARKRHWDDNTTTCRDPGA